MDGTHDFESAEKLLFRHYGVDYESHVIDIPQLGTPIRILSAGAGDPLLFVHGGLSVAAQYVPLIARLEGYRVVVPDRPGFGLSGPFSYRGSDLAEHAVTFIQGVMEACDLERSPIVANSMGGLWALRIALKHPERVSAMVQLGCPALLLGTSAPLPMRLLGVRGLNRMMAKLPSGNHERTLKMLGEKDAVPQLPKEYMEVMEAAGRLQEFWPTSLSLLESVLRLRGARPGIGLEEADLRKLSMPVHFIWGSQDPFGSIATAEQAAEIVPDSRLTIVDAGHLPWLADPSHVAGLIEEFLSARSEGDTKLALPRETSIPGN